MTDFDPDDYEVSEFGLAIKDINDFGELREIPQVEHRGQSRVPAIALVESRIEKLSEDEEPANADGLDLTSMSTAGAGSVPRGVEEVSELESLPECEEAGENRDPVKRLIGSRTDSVKGSDEGDTEVEVGDRTSEERHPDLDHPIHDRRHVRSLHGGIYRDMWVYCETQVGELIDVSKEVFGKVRELMDTYNDDYTTDKRVVAVLTGVDVSKHIEDVITYGADVVAVREDARLECSQRKPCTEILCDMARAGITHQNFGAADGRDEPWRGYDKPRYVLFLATNNDRDLSALVQAELDSGLVSDCSGLHIAEEVISNPVKTGVVGEKREFQRVLHTRRPNFSGFEYSTIPYIDNPVREFHPQGASVIPGSFDLPGSDAEREDLVVEHDASLDDDWFRVTVTTYDRLDEGIDLIDHEVIVTIGRGMGDDSTKGIELALDLVDQFKDAEVGVTRGIITGSFSFSGRVEQYIHEDRRVGETGQVVAPKLYIAAGISGAVQHEVGMDESDAIVVVNTDPDVRIRDFLDYFIEDGLFEVMPRLTAALKEGRFEAAVASDGGRMASTPPAGISDGGAGASAAVDDRGESR